MRVRDLRCSSSATGSYGTGHGRFGSAVSGIDRRGVDWRCDRGSRCPPGAPVSRPLTTSDGPPWAPPRKRRTQRLALWLPPSTL